MSNKTTKKWRVQTGEFPQFLSQIMDMKKQRPGAKVFQDIFENFFRQLNLTGTMLLVALRNLSQRIKIDQFNSIKLSNIRINVRRQSYIDKKAVFTHNCPTDIIKALGSLKNPR